MTTLDFTTVELMGAPFGDENPMPDLKNVSYIHATFATTERVSDEDKKYFGVGKIDTLLPYLSQDNYGRNRRMMPYKAAILENEYLKATFLPEVGGRLWSLIHKPTGRELLYKNEIVQPCNLALRNAWVAGGVEWNVGIKGHTPFTCDKLFTAESKNSKGEPVLTMYEYERIRGVVFGINAYLEGEYLYVRTSIENTAKTPTYAYWWSNIAVPEKGYRVLTDAEDMFTCLYGNNQYTIDKIPAPCFDGEDLSYPDRAKRAGDLFYVTNDERRKWIASVGEDGFGFLQYSTPELIGRKLFFWGQGQGGRNWNNFLSDSDVPYVEIQAGLLRTQMEHVPMAEESELGWTECYTALSLEPSSVFGEWKSVCRSVADYVATLPDPADADIPLDAEKNILMLGSGWGAVEKRKVSRYYSFPEAAVTSKENEWVRLLSGKGLVCPDPKEAPESYYVSKEALELLEKYASTAEGDHWYTYLHIGIIKYCSGDVEGAREAWERSVSLCKNAWSYRNLSMLLKNNYSDHEKAVEYMLCALNEVDNCRGLWVDAAKMTVDCGAYKTWLEISKNIPSELKNDGRLLFYSAMAHLRLGDIESAKGIINENFYMSDIKEGELSVSAIWKELYGDLSVLPARLDFRMHE